jgi:TRAP-type C4-dicarboxylate transport system permease small subunit
MDQPMIRLYDNLTRFYRGAGALCVIVMMAILLASIVMRELMGLALVWANEIAIALFVWSVFIGAGVAIAENAHIRFNILVERLPLPGRRTVGLLVSYVGLVLLAGFLVTSVYVTWVYRDQRFTTIVASVAWEWSAVPVGMLMAVLGWLRHGKWTWLGKELSEKPATEIAGT